MNLGMPAVEPALMHNTIDEAMEARIAESAAPASWSWKDQGAVTSVKVGSLLTFVNTIF